MSNALSIPTGSPVTSLPRCLKTSCANSGGCYKVRFENLCKHPLLLKVFETGQSHQTMGLVGETGLKGDGLWREPMAWPGKDLQVKGDSLVPQEWICF